MTVLVTHNLIWLKPHAGKAAGQPLSFKEKTQLARLRRLAFKGIVGKAEDHPEVVKAYKDSLKAEEVKAPEPKPEPAPVVEEVTEPEPTPEPEEVTEPEPEVESPKEEPSESEESSKKKNKKSKKNRG